MDNFWVNQMKLYKIFGENLGKNLLVKLVQQNMVMFKVVVLVLMFGVEGIQVGDVVVGGKESGIVDEFVVLCEQMVVM